MTNYLQNHIHMALTLGSSPELAPIYKWKVTDRLDTDVVFVTVTRALNLTYHRHAIAGGGGTIHLTNYRYTIKVQDDYSRTLDQSVSYLKAMNGELVYLCDNFHPNDGSDHTSAVKPFIAQVGSFAKVGPGLQYFLVDVNLEDASL